MSGTICSLQVNLILQMGNNGEDHCLLTQTGEKRGWTGLPWVLQMGCARHQGSTGKTSKLRCCQAERCLQGAQALCKSAARWDVGATVVPLSPPGQSRANPSLPAGIVLSGAQREVIISLTRARTGMKHDPLPPQHLSPRWFGRRSSGELLRNYRIESALTLDPRSTRFHM